jgi:hypothetical protein
MACAGSLPATPHGLVQLPDLRLGLRRVALEQLLPQVVGLEADGEAPVLVLVLLV